MTQSSADWLRVKNLFESAFEADSSERARLLTRESDAAVRQKVEAMLAAHDETEGPLDKPALESLDGLELSVLEATPSLVGRKLGPYRIVRELGTGGMGAVYEGVRDDAQFEHRVAIKTLRMGADSSSIMRRFEQERRILAQLKHPNIAAFYDGAITSDGLPYFVLEYVDGLRIDEHCLRNQLGLRERVELFLQVVAAVNYAHQQLVVHRDLKPNNVLVTPDGVVKLVDFGIAKLLVTDAPQVTGEAFAPLTIGYASPEQVKGEPITTASDVYSLGVLLYRLLTGVNPLDLDSLSLDRAVAALCIKVPTLSSNAATREAAEAMRLGSLEKLKRNLHGDLDAILATALRKEPERRYATAQAFGEDLRRYLDGRPVVAVKDSVRYRAGKFVRRKRGLVVAASVALLAIVTGGSAVLSESKAAREEARRAEAVSHFMQSVIGAGDVSASSRGARLGPFATVRDLIDSAAVRVPIELKNDPQARAEMHLALGASYVSQQRSRNALDQMRAAYDVARENFGENNIYVARALLGIAGIGLERGTPGSDSLAMRSAKIFEAVGAQATDDYARALRVMGLYSALSGNYPRGDTLLARAKAVYASVGSGPQVDKAMVIAEHAAVREALGRPWSESLRDYHWALAMLDSIPGAEVLEKGSVLWYAARAEAAGGHQKIADSLSMEALRVFERASGPNSGPVAQQLAQLAAIARAKGDTAASSKYTERAMKIINGNSDVLRLSRERVQSEYARLMWARGEKASAESLARVVHDSRVASSTWVYIVEADDLLGTILVGEGKYDEAEPILLDAYQRAAKGYTNLPSYVQYFARQLASLYLKSNQAEKAKPFLASLPDSVQKSLVAAALKH